MIEVTLPDGSKREFDSPVTVGDVAASIGAGLARAALAGCSGCSSVFSAFCSRMRSHRHSVQ